MGLTTRKLTLIKKYHQKIISLKMSCIDKKNLMNEKKVVTRWVTF